MTALIGGLCVGLIWGIWATRKLIKHKRKLNEILKHRQERNSKLDLIITAYNNGKEKSKKGQAGETGEDPNRH